MIYIFRNNSHVKFLLKNKDVWTKKKIYSSYGTALRFAKMGSVQVSELVSWILLETPCK